MTANTQQMLGGMIRKSADDLASAAGALGEKVDWKPLDKGRSALNQVQECGTICGLGSAILETQAVPHFDGESFGKMQADFDTPEKAMAMLTDNAEKLAYLAETLPMETLAKIVALPMLGGIEKSLGEVAMMCYWNNVYHEGQINYIQTLAAEDKPVSA